MTVRQATAADAAAMAAVAEEAWWAAYAAFLDADTVRDVVAAGYGEDRLAAAVEDGNLATPVAERDGEVVGFAVAEQTWADTVDIHALYVHPDRWGAGAGGALLGAVADWARERGVRYLRTTAFVDNHAAVGFFESQGFERRDRGPREVGDEVHEEFTLERDIDA